MAQTIEISTPAAEAAELSRTDLNFLGMLIDPEEFVFSFPAFYLTLFSLLTSFRSNLERYAIGIPRGFAKTTFLKLLCLWYILFSSKSFILLVGASQGLAVNTLSDIWDMLSSDGIRKVFGNAKLQVEVDTQDFKVFHFRGRSIILRAIGAGTAVRGINRKNRRPDVIILDDVQTREDSENAELAAALLRWITGTLMKARSNAGCTYIYVGNMYPRNCILEKLKNNTQWTSLIVGGILADGASLWEELRPIDDLLSEYQADQELGLGEIFVSEILNSTDVALASGLDVNKIPLLPDYYTDTEPDGSFIVIDPSSGKKKGDDCTINHFSLIDGKPIMDKVLYGTFTPLETIEKAVDMGLANNTRLICVEDVAYQSTLLFWFQHICESRGISGFEFHPVAPRGQAKNNRIKRGLLRLMKAEIYLHPEVRSLVISQITEWNPAKVDNKDDIIDPIGYCEEIEQNYGHLAIKQVFDVETSEISAAHSDKIALPF